MPKRMLIDASHPEETRVVVIDGNRVEEFDFESAAKRPLKGNIYLAKVTRVEPSLQAAFVEYGGNRQGFLAFSEIHPDYYQIPVADRMAILQAQTERMMAEDDIESIDTRHSEEQPSAISETPQSDNGESAESPAEPAEVYPEQPLQEPAEAAAVPDDVAGREEIPVPDAQTESIQEIVPDAAAQEITETGGAAPEALEDDNENVPADVADTTVSAPQPEELPHDTSVAAEAEPGAPTAAGEPVPVEVVQAESTGAPVAYQRREHPRFGGSDRPRPRRRQYKIQEVIKRRQVMLVQVVKEERGNKGASLTTFLSLAGRYCVLMPNTPRGGGISRKITNAVDRKRLKAAAQSLELPEGMGLIIRTAGANRTKAEIKRDYEYLLRLWDTVRELTLKSNAPALVYEEGSLIKRAIRDLYSKEISEIIVDGEEGYREAKEFMRMLMPSHAKNVKLYREPLPLFQRLQVESQLDAMFSPVVNLKSGGYVVINQTEALVAIDVNSGKATREHSIEETALKTNLEAADEIARQLRLRDLAGLIVIDFIDMEDTRNDRLVEKRLLNALRNDRARIQIGRISQFGLLELSRQRLRAGVVAGSTITCPHCNGQGIVRSTESAALRLLRALDEEGQQQRSVNLTVKTPSEVAIYTLNQKRRELARIEEAYDVAILFDPQPNMASGSFEIQRTGMRVPSARPKLAAVSVEGGFQPAETPPPEPDVTIVEPPEAPVAAPEQMTEHDSGAAQDARGRKRRRRRRGGRGRTGRFGPTIGDQEVHAGEAQSPETVAEASAADESAETAEGDDAAGEPELEISGNGGQAPVHADGGERRRRRRRRGRRGRRFDTEIATSPGAPAPAQEDTVTADITEIVHATIATEHVVQSEQQYEVHSGAVTAVLPNSPSSPVWSLLDRQASPHQSEPEHSRTTQQPSRAEIPAAETRADETLTPEPAAEPTPENIVAEPPREIRKGWWQRRFKA